MTIHANVAETLFAKVPAPAEVAALPHARAAIVIPCYNEAARLDTQAFLDFADATPGVSLVFVNDGSSDNTLDVLASMMAARPGRIEVLSLAQNSGKAEAVRQGLLHAAASGARMTGYWDADLATPLHAIPDFMRIAARYNEIDVVFGSRRGLLGHRIRRSLARRSVSRICSMLARLAVRLPVGDTQCGAKLLRVTPALRAALAEPFTAGWLFDVELFSRISARTACRRSAFFELPLAEWTEIPGSKVSARAILRSGFQMLRLIARSRLGRAALPATEAAAEPVPARLAA